MATVYNVEHHEPEIGIRTLLVCFLTGFWPILICPIDYPDTIVVVPVKVPPVPVQANETGAPKLIF